MFSDKFVLKVKSVKRIKDEKNGAASIGKAWGHH